MRVLFTVALAVAVAAVSIPAIDAVGVERAETRTDAAVDHLVTAARTLAAGNDALPPEQGPARQVVELDLPQGGLASARLASLTIEPPESGGTGAGPSTTEATRITWRVAGGTRHLRQVAGLRIRAETGGRFVTGGRHQLVLRLVRRQGHRIVTVSVDSRTGS